MSIFVSAYNTPVVKKAVNSLAANNGAKLGVLKKHLPAVVGMYISGFYVLNTMMSKGIPEERKMPLAINSVFCGIFGAAGGYVVAPWVNKFTKALGERMTTVLKNMPADDMKLLQKGIKSIVPLFVFTFMFRYLAPVLATPVADKVNKFMTKKGWLKGPAQAKKEDPKQVPMTSNNIKAPETKGANLDVTAGSPLASATDANFQQFLQKVNFQPKSSLIA